MKRKKWTEEEERSLLSAYSSSTSSSGPKDIIISKLKIPRRRQKRLQPIADRINSLHHLSDPSSYPFLWSWRDVAIKIHNMRHQYLNVKHRILLLTSNNNNNNSFDSELALDLWPNFLRYQQVFGDIHIDPIESHPSTSKANHFDSDDDDGDDEQQEEEEDDNDCNNKKKKNKKRKKQWREQKREEEEMEWMERMVGMQVEHEKQAMQMHANACQAQTQLLAILVRALCQFLCPGTAGPHAGLPLPTQLVDNQQQQQQPVADDGRELAGGVRMGTI